jgi:ABC-2 type transport system permease protein
MKKLLNIAWKDFTLMFRDRSALLLMLAAPFALTLGMGFVTGRFSGGGSSLGDIPVTIVNQDEGELGAALVAVFESDDLAELLSVMQASDPATARAQVQADEVAAAVIVPAGFTAGIIPGAGSPPGDDAPSIELVSNSARPISAGVVEAIVESFVSRVETGRVSGVVAVSQLIASRRLDPSEAVQAGRAIGERMAAGPGNKTPITLNVNNSGATERLEFDVLGYLAPGMALVFLMYTVSMGGRSILAERHDGTLPRMLTTPTTAAQVLGGKVLGIFMLGVAQIAILIGASTLLFNLRWGDTLALLTLVPAVVAGATGWGILLAAVARTPAQVSSVGSAMMLTFGVLGGNFTNFIVFPDWLQAIGKITPNAWGQQAFTALSLGGTLADIGAPIAALLAMAAVLFGAAIILFRRSGVAQR